MMALRFRQHRPQSVPAPHALATCLAVLAPPATASMTALEVVPVHRHTYIDDPFGIPTAANLGKTNLGEHFLQPVTAGGVSSGLTVRRDSLQ